jgi:hypothetical protein
MTGKRADIQVALISIDYSGAENILIIQCTSPAHEIGEVIFACAEKGPPQYWPKECREKEFRLRSPPFPNMESTGTTTIKLQKDKKSADYSLVDATPGQHPIFRNMPTVVVEVAYQETSKKLAEDCGRWIACSLGRVLLAVGFDVKLKNQPEEGEVPEIDRVVCYFWELVEATRLDALPAGVELDTLTRDDEYADLADEFAVPPATSFHCVSFLGKQKTTKGKPDKPVYMKYQAGITATFQVWASSSSFKNSSVVDKSCICFTRSRLHQMNQANRCRFCSVTYTASPSLSTRIKLPSF